MVTNFLIIAILVNTKIKELNQNVATYVNGVLLPLTRIQSYIKLDKNLYRLYLLLIMILDYCND